MCDCDLVVLNEEFHKLPREIQGCVLWYLQFRFNLRPLSRGRIKPFDPEDDPGYSLTVKCSDFDALWCEFSSRNHYFPRHEPASCVVTLAREARRKAHRARGIIHTRLFLCTQCCEHGGSCGFVQVSEPIEDYEWARKK